MKRDVVSVRLWLARIEVLGVIVDAPGELVVRVASTVRRPRCPDWGTPSGGVHDRGDNKVRDLEVSGRPATLIWERRRLVCEPCGSRFVEDHQGFEGRVTARLARRLVKDARAMTVNAAAKRHQVGWKLVNSLVVAWAGLVGEHRRRQRCRVLGVEGTSIRKRHRYVTVIVNGDTGEVLAMVAHRDTQALSGFLAAQGPRWCKAVKVVVSDGSKAYKAAIEARLGHARHVLDRFHVIRRFQAGLTAVRRDIQRRPEGSVPAFDPEVFGARFLLMRRPDKLDAGERARLDALFAAHPRLKAAWDALAELHGLYLADDREGALEALDRFADIYRTGHIPEFSDTVDTFLAWHNQILDWHHAGRPSNGRIDRTNNLHPSPATPSPRLHQLRQLRSPRPPPNMNPAEPSSPNPNKRRRLIESACARGCRCANRSLTTGGCRVMCVVIESGGAHCSGCADRSHAASDRQRHSGTMIGSAPTRIFAGSAVESRFPASAHTGKGAYVQPSSISMARTEPAYR